MKFERGEKVIWKNRVVTVLGPKDSDGYNLNYPGHKWELVLDTDGTQYWVGNIHLKKIGKK